jgi:hypothetical protein
MTVVPAPSIGAWRLVMRAKINRSLPDDPKPPLNQTANSLKAFDDGHKLIDVRRADLGRGGVAFVVAVDTVGRIGEPDRATGDLLRRMAQSKLLSAEIIALPIGILPRESTASSLHNKVEGR